MLCEQYYLTSPDMEITEFNCTSLVGGGGVTLNHVSIRTFLPLTAKSPNQPLDIVYVPSHLYHMLFELFKVK